MNHNNTDTETTTETRIAPLATDASSTHIIGFGQAGSGITHHEDDPDRHTRGDG